jgi:hypothetical protein
VLRYLTVIRCADVNDASRAGAVDNEIKNNVSSIKWHTDMSYEM